MSTRVIYAPRSTDIHDQITKLRRLGRQAWIAVLVTQFERGKVELSTSYRVHLDVPRIGIQMSDEVGGDFVAEDTFDCITDVDSLTPEFVRRVCAKGLLGQGARRTSWNKEHVVLLTDASVKSSCVESVKSAIAAASHFEFREISTDEIGDLSASTAKVAILACEEPLSAVRYIASLRNKWSAHNAIIAFTARQFGKTPSPGVFAFVADEGNLVQLPQLVRTILEAEAAQHLQKRLAHLEESIDIANALTEEAFWVLDKASSILVRYHATLPGILGIKEEALADDQLCWLNHCQIDGEPLTRTTMLQILERERFNLTLEIAGESAQTRYVQLMGQTVLTNFGPRQTVVGVARDITEAVERERAANERATRDPLTKLPNRALLQDRVNFAIHSARRTNAQLAVLYIDLDLFKAINDKYGHAAGDHVLQVSAQRMQTTLRLSDTVARIGGDEFVVILQPLNKEIGPSQVAQKLISALMEPIAYQGHELKIGASIGISIFPHDGSSYEELMSKADIALYRAKAGGRCTFALYRRDLDLRSHQDLRNRNSLEQAIKGRTLAVHYQPILDMRTGQSDCVEALIRPGSSDLESIAPSHLISIAEEMGLIDDLGEWVASEVFHQVCEWNYSGLIGVHVAINLSPLQLKSGRFPDVIRNLLSKHRLDANLFSVELRESALMDTTSNFSEGVRALSKMGIRVAIDDYGTSFSNLSKLRHIPISHIKIDSSLIQQVHTPGQQSFIGGLIELAHRINLTVIAEGVETKQQLERLNQLNCDFAQGFEICHPVSGKDLQDILLNWRPIINLKHTLRAIS